MTWTVAWRDEVGGVIAPYGTTVLLRFRSAVCDDWRCAKAEVRKHDSIHPVQHAPVFQFGGGCCQRMDCPGVGVGPDLPSKSNDWHANFVYNFSESSLVPSPLDSEVPRLSSLKSFVKIRSLVPAPPCL